MKVNRHPGRTAGAQSPDSGSRIEASDSKGKASFERVARLGRSRGHCGREWLSTIEHPKKRLFLEIYANSGHASMACRAVGIGRTTEWLWRKRDAQFAALREQAQAMAVEALEDEARRRAIDGTLEPVFAGGRLCGSIRRYSDSLLIFLLKAAKPEVYRDRWRGSVHVIAEPSAFRGLDLARLSEAQLGQLEEIAAAATRETGMEDAGLGRLIDFADDMAGP